MQRKKTEYTEEHTNGYIKKPAKSVVGKLLVSNPSESNHVSALSLFAKTDSPLSEHILFGQMAFENCTDFHAGHRDDPEHDSWHLGNNDDFDITHTHIIKQNNKMITPTEFKCLLDQIMEIDKNFRMDWIKEQGSEEGLFCTNSGCETYDPDKTIFLSKKDYDHLLRTYTKYFENNQSADQAVQKQKTI